jgi:hypothetical protein
MGIVLLATLLCGVAAADLPASVNAAISYPGTHNSYWDIRIIDGSGDLPSGSIWLGWCVDSQTTISQGTYTFPVYSSLNLPSGSPDYIKGIYWNKVNYIINNKAIGNNNMQAIQAAIWTYDGGIPKDTATYKSWFESADYTALVTAADANGESYTPGPGKNYAVILYKPGYQCLMIEVPIPNIPVPEFPMLAVPVILLVAAVYLVSVIKKKNK